MTSSETTKKLIDFIEKSPSVFHTAETIKGMLLGNNFSELQENERWNITTGGNYFVTRNNSSLIAFSIPENNLAGMHIIASHSDSPTFKIKENPEIEADHHYIKLNVERYGGMLCAPWLDRPLSIAGRVIFKDDTINKFQSKLININKDLVLIPNLAIHMNRDANNGYSYNPQKDLLPLYGNLSSKDTFMKKIAETANISEEDILGHDLFLYNRQKASIWGASDEFISAPRLDDLQCVFASVEGFLAGQKKTYMPILCVLDNEEVGSGTKQGAASTFLYDTLTRINTCLGLSNEDYLIRLSDSFMISADNAHAVHPNHPDCSDPVNHPYLNGGIVIKFNANQKYCTDGFSAAVFRDLCRSVHVPVQTFVNRSDIAGGSTLGNISSTHVAVSAVDIGLPQLAMHSPYETAGAHDTDYFVKVATEFFC
ncbi:M18 family aminopeptidase [Mediterraneibacter sp.]|uniref:M18 family aminopeptidase n=1 Tax=Mediterraneibacter sp. TaxID=2316022 RepID=UPI0015A907FA|nr:M18 family aminopeptidase [Mediterraneibacter sp.]